MLQSTELTPGNSGDYDFREELNLIKCYKAKVVNNKNMEVIGWGDGSRKHANNFSLCGRVHAI